MVMVACMHFNLLEQEQVLIFWVASFYYKIVRHPATDHCMFFTFFFPYSFLQLHSRRYVIDLENISEPSTCFRLLCFEIIHFMGTNMSCAQIKSDLSVIACERVLAKNLGLINSSCFWEKENEDSNERCTCMGLVCGSAPCLQWSYCLNLVLACT